MDIASFEQSGMRFGFHPTAISKVNFHPFVEAFKLNKQATVVKKLQR